MRAIVFEEPYSITIRVEGDLTADSTNELSRRLAAWREMTADKKMRLDLGDISRVDAKGAAWLRDVSGRGIVFTAMSPAVQQIVFGFLQLPKENLRSWLARIGIRISPPAGRERMGFLRRLVCAVLPAGIAGCPCER